MGLPVKVQIQAGRGLIRLAGDLDAQEAAHLERQLTDIRLLPAGLLIVEMQELELLDGQAVVALVNGLRHLRKRVARLEVHGAPQILGHNLYRINSLAAGGETIVLCDMREDEAYG